jgi:hypothetical protein
VEQYIMNLPSVIAYHPEINVLQDDGNIAVIKLTISDFATDSEILTGLAEDLGVRTVGEIMEAIRAGSVASVEMFEIAELLNHHTHKVWKCDDVLR